MTIGTDDNTALFAGPQALRQAFDARLAQLVDHPVLGVFVLALANAGFDQATFDRLRGGLQAAFIRWCTRFDDGDPQAVGAAPDDVDVFRRLRDVGLDHLGVTRWRRCGPWELQFNPLRAFRPPRMSHQAVTVSHRPFDPDAFHFNKPFLRDEILWEGELSGVPLRLLYNKFPFAERHGLLVPEARRERPQWLDAQAHQQAWAIVAQLGRVLPGIGLGYNAYGAFASVNHLHFQLFERSAGHYPVEDPCWRHNGGDTDYPAAVQCLVDGNAAWQAIDRLHREGRVYNLLYRPGRLYLAARARQGEYRHSAWTGGFAWSELAGSITLFDERVFEKLDESAIADEFARLAVRP